MKLAPPEGTLAEIQISLTFVDGPTRSFTIGLDELLLRSFLDPHETVKARNTILEVVGKILRANLFFWREEMEDGREARPSA